MGLSKVLSAHLILASKSPRRLQLLQQMGFEVETVEIDVEEITDEDLEDYKKAEQLSIIKNKAYTEEIPAGSVLVTADTLVFCDGKALGKPQNAEQAKQYLKLLSGKAHKVITACTVRSSKSEKTFHETAKVYFKHLSEEEIRYYIERYKPFDKAGAYGIQEWIGLIGIEKTEGDYYTIMGLPCQRLFAVLSEIEF